MQELYFWLISFETVTRRFYKIPYTTQPKIPKLLNTYLVIITSASDIDFSHFFVVENWKKLFD